MCGFEHAGLKKKERIHQRYSVDSSMIRNGIIRRPDIAGCGDRTHRMNRTQQQGRGSMGNMARQQRAFHLMGPSGFVYLRQLALEGVGHQGWVGERQLRQPPMWGRESVGHRRIVDASQQLEVLT